MNAKGSEKTFRRLVAKGLKPYGHIVQIENLTSIGHPDTNYCIDGEEGHVELKYIRKWPARAKTLVKIDHYTPLQRLWILKRVLAGGKAFLFVQVEKDEWKIMTTSQKERTGDVES